MIIQPTTTRRGVALLVVLATVLIVSLGMLSLTQSASTIRVQRDQIMHARMTDDLLVAAQAPILAWLKDSAADIVLHDDALEPRVDVLHDAWRFNDLDYEIQITAWDQCGMAPLDTIQSGQSIRSTLPDSILRELDSTQRTPQALPGLDLFATNIVNGTPIQVFPTAVHTSPHEYVTNNATHVFNISDANSVQRNPDHHTNNLPALGALVATHNPGRINVNTAPQQLLYAAFLDAGRGGAILILQARNEDHVTRIASPDTAPDTYSENHTQSPTALILTDTSMAWAFRIDIRVENIRRSWWEIHVSNGSQWRCVQRLAITD